MLLLLLPNSVLFDRLNIFKQIKLQYYCEGLPEQTGNLMIIKKKAQIFAYSSIQGYTHYLQTYINIININMGKEKHQQRQKRKKVITSGHDKERMKSVLEKLAQNKLNTEKIVAKFNVPISKKDIKKQKKKLGKNHVEQDHSPQESQVQPADHSIKNPKPIINIFAVDNYLSQKPIEVHNPIIDKKNQMQDQGDLESKAMKLMGGNFNLQKFGDKPMRAIEENNQPLVMSEDQDQPNSLKTVTHTNIKVPEGNKSINRTKEIQQLRQKLPIFMKQQQIIQTINNHLVTLICGQTGSGKSTQLPQFLTQKNYESLGKIAITQPRRLATISLARRVAEQMHCKIGRQVAYQVRHERKQSKESFIKFMTDGILLKQMSSDPLLLEYSVIIIDEAHERKLNTDILIGLLSKLILVRYKMSQQKECNPLRLVIMSATLRVKDFQNEKLFNFLVPILKVEAKMFPVTIFHEKNTPENYINSAVKKCVKIHKQLPPGDVLIFLTGKQQIHEMYFKLEMELGRLKFEQKQDMEDENEQEIKAEGQYFQSSVRKNSQQFLKDFVIYKLYSSLPTEEQDKIFKTPHANCRKFIISTNIAQTSITVPNIRYVIDSGQEKHRYFEDVWRWRKGWGSKAMAAQRTGRAGRTTHGYCYRLYSAALYANIMQQHPEPQICRLPLESVVLEIKSIGFNNIFSFPFPTPPPVGSLKKSIEVLLEVGAVEGQIDMFYLKNTKQNTQNIEHKPKVQLIDKTKITQLGKIISFIPLNPRLSKMLLIGNKLNLEKHILLCTILLTVQSIFTSKYTKHNQADNQNVKNKLLEQKRKQISQFHKKYQTFIDKESGSDLFISMNIVGGFLAKVYQQYQSNNKNKVKNSLGENQSIMNIINAESARLELNSNVMRQFYYNCDQISEIFQTLTSKKVNLSIYQKPTRMEYTTLSQILLSAYSKNVCRFDENNKYQNSFNQPVYIHRMSVLYKEKLLFVSCIDFYLNETNNRKYMRYPFKIQNYELLATYGTIKEPSDYEWNGEQVVGKTTGQIFNWEIPNLVIKDLKGENKFYAFGRMLLNGDVIPSFKILSERNWLNGTVSALRPDNLQQKVQRLVMQLRKNSISQKQKLIQTMKENPQFLQKELRLWLNVKNYEAVYKTLRKFILSAS